jgi:hypothetical protein
VTGWRPAATQREPVVRTNARDRSANGPSGGNECLASAKGLPSSLLAIALPSSTPSLAADPYHTKNISMVVPYSPGGAREGH